MPRKPPPPPPKGTRVPGSGAKPGTPHKLSVEARTLVSEMVNDPAYQLQLRKDFRDRKLHPTIEALIWTYHLGKPRQELTINGGLAVEVRARLEEDRRAFALLDVTELEALAAESQALIDKATALGRARLTAGQPLDIVEAELLHGSQAEVNVSEGAEESDNTHEVNDLTITRYDSASDNGGYATFDAGTESEGQEAESPEGRRDDDNARIDGRDD